jgi:hypothetical protein
LNIIAGIKLAFLGGLLFWVLPFLPVAQAQSQPVQFSSFLVELWPEYDQPNVLVIYRAELAPNVSLPAQITFRLPGYVERTNAVAHEQNGFLLAVDPEMVTLTPEGDASLLTFSAPSRKVQVEYYDAGILTRQDGLRRIEYSFVAPYEIEAASFEVQEPAQTQDFSLVPQPSRSFTDNSGLRYNVVELAGLAPGEVITLTATYQRDTEALSTQLLGLVSEHAPDLGVGPAASTRSDITIAYILMGAGALLFLGAIGHWWYNRQKMKSVPQRRRAARPVRHQKQPTSRVNKPRPVANPAVAEPAPGFCYRCGAALRPEANFCHVCGAERRQE